MVHPEPVADGLLFVVVTCHPFIPTLSVAVHSKELYVFLVTVTVGFVLSSIVKLTVLLPLKFPLPTIYTVAVPTFILFLYVKE